MKPQSDYSAPELIWGDGAIRQLPEVVEDGRWNTVLVVCGRRSFQASGAARILPGLEAVADVEQWSGFQANPDASDVVDGLRVVRDADPDVIVGIGGGSALDTAKLLGGMDDMPDPAAVVEAIASGAPVERRRRGLILVPTTSGSGSEATHFATVYTDAEKHSVAGPALRPDAVILDPLLTLSASPYQKASSGIDAVAQAVESLWAAGATSASRRFARRALRHLISSIEPFVHDATTDSAHGMLVGSHLAGRAIDISRTTAAHALSYAITQVHGVPHGHAVALTLGSFIEAHAGVAPGRLQPRIDPVTHAEVMAEICAVFGADEGTEAREAFLALMGRLGLFGRLTDAGATTAEHRKTLAGSVNPERLGNNPVTFDEEELAAILERSG